MLDKSSQHFTHGYTVTSHAAQERTVDEVLVVMPAATFAAVGKEAAYVSVSRGRFKATIYTDRKPELRDQWAKEDQRMLATDLVRRPKKGIRQRLHRHVSWLRAVADRGMDRVLGREMGGMSYGRE